MILRLKHATACSEGSSLKRYSPDHCIGRRLAFAGTLLALLAGLPGFSQTSAYQQTNLVSDGTAPAMQTDPTLINPWGIAIGQQTPFWLNDAGSGFPPFTT